MLVRTDPFRELDRVASQVFGTVARPAAMPMDAWRDGDTFVIEFDLPAIDPQRVELDVERNVLTVRAERLSSTGPDVELIASVTVAIISPARSRDRLLGESAQEVAAMGGPDEPFGHDRIALVVDLEPSAVHEPGPGALDDPASRERFELARVDAVHNFYTDVMVAAVFDEGALEAGVAPQLGEASRATAGPIRDSDPTDVV